ncbi:MAG: hypothetical protein QMC36_00640 [Patescibacteria group bacterium]
MRTPSPFRKPAIAAFAFFGTFLTLSLGYAAWDGTMASVTSGSPLSASNWNAIVNNVNQLNDRSAVMAANSVRSD